MSDTTARQCLESSDGEHVWTRRRDGKRCAFCGALHFGDSTLTDSEHARLDAVQRMEVSPKRDYLHEAYRMKMRQTLMIPEREHIDQLVDLIREAHNALTNPESRVDLRDWVQSAERVLKA